MIRVYLIAAPEDDKPTQEVADYLKRWGFWVRVETGQFGFPPARHGRVDARFVVAFGPDVFAPHDAGQSGDRCLGG